MCIGCDKLRCAIDVHRQGGPRIGLTCQGHRLMFGQQTISRNRVDGNAHHTLVHRRCGLRKGAVATMDGRTHVLAIGALGGIPGSELDQVRHGPHMVWMGFEIQPMVGIRLQQQGIRLRRTADHPPVLAGIDTVVKRSLRVIDPRDGNPFHRHIICVADPTHQSTDQLTDLTDGHNARVHQHVRQSQRGVGQNRRIVDRRHIDAEGFGHPVFVAARSVVHHLELEMGVVAAIGVRCCLKHQLPSLELRQRHELVQHHRHAVELERALCGQTRDLDARHVVAACGVVTKVCRRHLQGHVFSGLQGLVGPFGQRVGEQHAGRVLHADGTVVGERLHIDDQHALSEA